MSEQLEIVKPGGGQVVRRAEEGLSLEQAWEAVKSGEMSAERLAVMKEILHMSAEAAFNQDFCRMQAEIKKVQATHAVPDKQGNTKYKIAALEEIDDAARPIYSKYGFSVSFSEAPRQPGMVTAICVLRHIKGHKELTPHTVRIGAGPVGANDTQADNAAHTAACRRALCKALNIIIGHDEDDANEMGQPITADQAASLERRVKATKSDRELFLKFAQAKSFAEIMSSRYEELDARLAKRERIQKAQADADVQKRINESKP